MNVRQLLFRQLLEYENTGVEGATKEQITAEINRRLTWARNNPDLNSLRVYCEQMNNFAWKKRSKND